MHLGAHQRQKTWKTKEDIWSGQWQNSALGEEKPGPRNLRGLLCHCLGLQLRYVVHESKQGVSNEVQSTGDTKEQTKFVT